MVDVTLSVTPLIENVKLHHAVLHVGGSCYVGTLLGLHAYLLFCLGTYQVNFIYMDKSITICYYMSICHMNWWPKTGLQTPMCYLHTFTQTLNELVFRLRAYTQGSIKSIEAYEQFSSG